MSKFIEVESRLGKASVRIESITTFSKSEFNENETKLYILNESEIPSYISESYEEFKKRIEENARWNNG